MNLKLTRTAFRPDGIFGRLEDARGHFSAVTLEHSYECKPKLPPGTYLCRRGMHRLPSMDHDFETFEISGVPGHTGILFHIGNWNRDSEGCVLLGLAVMGDRIISSRAAFAQFMEALHGIEEFTLEVV